MAPCQSPVDHDLTSFKFFDRCGLPRDTWSQCWDLAFQVFPHEEIQEEDCQGGCSYTLCVGRDTIVQFRPTVHKLDVRVTAAAQDIYGSLAPQTRLLKTIEVPKSCAPDDAGGHSHRQPVDGPDAIDDGCHKSHTSLHMYSLSRIPGFAVADLRASWRGGLSTAADLRRQRGDVISEFARFIAIGWDSARPASDPTVPSLRGRIGGSIRWRLQQMHTQLPARFQPAVGNILGRLDDVESLPWVLTHGDVVPANMMVLKPHDASASREVVLSGFVDWAEAEFLPFGVGFYGLEALLGETGRDGRFGYYPEAEELRQDFWLRLEAEIPRLRLGTGSGGFRENIEIAHALGVLLWHGIAFDNGKLDRVVDEQRIEDAEEVRILDLFFARNTEYWNEGVKSGHRAQPERDRLFLRRAFSGIWTRIRRLGFGDRRMGRS